MNSELIEKIKVFLKEKRKKKWWRRMNYAVSTLVTVTTIYVLIYPAIAASSGVNLNTLIVKNLITTDSSLQANESSVLPKTRILTQNQITTPNMIGEAPLFSPNLFSNLRNGGTSFFSAGGTSLTPVGEPFQLKDYIRGAYINGTLITQETPINLQPGSTLKLKFEYEFAEGTLVPDNPNTIPQDERRNTFVYTMDKIKASEYIEGKIYQRIHNSENQEEVVECGIFKVGKDENEAPDIPENHKTAEDRLFLIFDNVAVERNRTLRFDEGTVSFEALIAEVDVGDNGEIISTLADNITAKLQFSASIQVEKRAKIENISEGIIAYTIKIKSPTGTGGPISVVDNMICNAPSPNSKTLHAITDLTVKKKTRSGWTVLPSINITNYATDFTFSLERLKPGEEYELSYKAKLAETINTKGQVNTVNAVEVKTNQYRPNQTTELRDRKEAYAEIQSKNLLEKASFLYMIENRAKVKWTVTVNSDRMNIDGWVLSDKLNGITYSGPVKIYRNNETPQNIIRYNGSENISLPFTFSAGTVYNTRDKFIVTYYSTAPNPGESVTNTAILQKGTKKVEAKDTFTRDMNEGVLSKWFDKLKIEKAGENFIIKIFWNISIEAPNDRPIRAPWVLYDRLSSLQKSQHFTPEEIQRLNADMQSLGYGITVEGIKFKDGVYRGFKVMGSQDIPEGQRIDISAISTDNLGSEGKGETYNHIDPEKNIYDFFLRDYYGNRCIITQNGNTNWPGDEEYKIGANLKYDTPIIKWDKDSGSVPQRENTYNYYAKQKEGTVFPLNGNNLMKWEVWATIPRTYNRNHEMIIRDFLPEGLTFDKNELEMKWHEGSLGFFHFGDGNEAQVSTGSGHTIRAKYFPDQRTVEIRLTKAHVESLYSGSGNIVNRYPVRFVIGARIDNPEQTLPNSLPGKEFRNEARLYFREISEPDEEADEIGLMAHTKKVFKSGQKVTLYKNHGESGFQNNKIHYKLIVNPKGEKLLPIGENTRLKLEDIFSYQTSISSMLIFQLDTSSVKVYEDTGDGEVMGTASDPELTQNTSPTGTPDENSFRYNYNENQELEGSTINVSKRMNFDIPDSKRLRIEYDYKVIQGDAGVDFSVTNSANLRGYESQIGNSQTSIVAQISQGIAGVGGKGFRFKKIGVRELDSGEKEEFVLNDVKFQIHKYLRTDNLGNEIYEPLKTSEGEVKIFTTGNDGSFYFNEYDYNRAYKLVEVSAPVGYIKMKDLEFFANHSNTITHPDKMPSGFRERKGVRVCYVNMVQRVENENNETDITIQKIWKDSQGNIINREGGEVTAKLYRKVNYYSNGEATGAVGEEEVSFPIVLNPAGGWKVEGIRLPKKDGSNSENEKRYKYYVKEASTADSGRYEVSYSHNETMPITNGTITITNREKWMARLPETGGGGKKSFYIIGLWLVISAVLGLLLHKRFIEIKKEGI